MGVDKCKVCGMSRDDIVMHMKVHYPPEKPDNVISLDDYRSRRDDR